MTLEPTRVMLRRCLVADAAISGITGLVMLAGADVLAGALGLPAPLIRYAGLVLVPFAAGVLYIARSAALSRSQVLTVVAVNLAWAAASVLLLATGWIEPTSLGVAFVLFQAFVVAGLAELQYAGLRRVAAAAA